MKNIQPLIQRALPHIGALIFFFILNSLFFYPQFSGLEITQHDIAESYGKNIEVRDHYNENGRQALWSNNIFAGMPAFYNGMQYSNNLNIVEKPMMFFMGRPIGFFMVYMICTYLALLLIGLRPLESLIGAVGYGFATNNIILYEAGHLFKNGSLMYSPFIIAGTIMMLRKKLTAGALIYAIGLGLSIKWHHVQMTYYLYLCLAILGVIYLVKFIKENNAKQLGKVLLFAVIATAIGLASASNRLLTTWDYSSETMRGEPILVEKAGQMSSSSTTEGLDWEYAMGWSNNTLDVLSGIVPGIVGGGSGERMDWGSTYDALRRAGHPPDVDGTYALPMYWGDLPFTSGPIYFGAIMMFLFVLAMFLVKGPMKWWLVASVVFTIMISYGKNMEWFNRLLFEYVPMFNKFRTPNSVLSITTMLIPILGAMGLHAWFKGGYASSQKIKWLLYSTGITGGFCLVLALLGPGMFSFAGSGDAAYAQSGLLELIVEDRKAMLRSDGFRSFIFIALAALALWLMEKGKLSTLIALSAILLFVVIDFWGVNRRYLKPSDFTGDRQTIIDTYYAEREVDRQIKARHDNRGEYRVLDLSINTFNTNRASFHHNTIGGYSAVKLQRIQDMIDLHISRMNIDVLNMLNTTYIIGRGEELQVNPDAMGWVWLVNDIRRVDSPREEIEALNDFDPAATAVVLDSEFDNYTAGLNPTGEGRIERTVYDLDRWVYEYEVVGDQLAVFSEIWYKPEKGLKAFVNGEEVPFIRANYCLRAIKVPSGSGTIEFRFEPRSYIVGNAITQLTSGFLVLALLGWMGFVFYQNKDNLLAPIEPKPAKTEVKKVQKTKRRKKS